VIKNINIILLSVIFLFLSDAYSYDNEITHRDLTSKAIEKSALKKYVIGNLGFNEGLEAKFLGKSILRLVRDGSYLEDIPNCRATNHFHNPLKPWDQSYMSDDPGWLGFECSSWKPWYSNITWATGYLSPNGPQITRPRQWMGWGDAWDYYYWALTSTSNKDRENYLVKTFQALGQVLHLIQDVSVPAHVRNDFTSHYLHYGPDHIKFLRIGNQFEHYIKENPQLVAEAKAERPEFQNPRVVDFWDTDQYRGDNPSTSLSLGLAEFINANYFSEWTIPNNNPDPKHSFLYPAVNRDNTVICEDFAPGSTDIRRYISRRTCPPLSEARKADHFAAISLVNVESVIRNENISSLKLDLDDNVNHTYAQEILPRAVGYSAALLDYFFRGGIEISMSEEGVYALTDKPEEGFKKITLLAKNVSAEGEDMPEGTIELVVKYKMALEDPFQSKPVPTTGEFAYILVPEAGGVRSIPRGEPAKLVFELGDKAIPLWATDVYFQLVYRGKLGQEEGAVAVGFKDISEPTPVDYVNNMDRICLYGNWYVAGSPEAIDLVDTNKDGRADVWDPYPHNLKDLHFKFSPYGKPQYASETKYDYSFPFLEAGAYARIYILGDYQFHFSSYDLVVNTHSDDWFTHLPHYYYLTKYGITNQVVHEETQVCCEITGTPHCGPDYSDLYCCERLYEQGCEVRYYPGFSSFRGVQRWKGAMITTYMPAYPPGTECNWDLLE